MNLGTLEVACEQYRELANCIEAMLTGQVRSIGPEHICHCVWNDFNINELILSEGVSAHVLPLIQTLVISRLISPGSEVHTWQWANHRSALYELTGAPLRSSLNSLYRAGGRLLECKDALEKHLAKDRTVIIDAGIATQEVP